MTSRLLIDVMNHSGSFYCVLDLEVGFGHKEVYIYSKLFNKKHKYEPYKKHIQLKSCSADVRGALSTFDFHYKKKFLLSFETNQIHNPTTPKHSRRQVLTGPLCHCNTVIFL